MTQANEIFKMREFPKNRQTINTSIDIEDEFRQFITDADHPCIMAKTATKFNRVEIHEYDDFGSMNAAKEIIANTSKYINSYEQDTNEFESILAVFPNENGMTEKEFESKLWKQLSLIAHVDSQPWDKKVSKNPQNPNFSFSISGKAFYIVGLHPNSSRKARRFKYPAIAFNFHHQFEKLREIGSYHKVRDTIRKRDLNKHGSINPMLQDFGKNSEAIQYSGRAVEKNWECPFKHDLNRKL